MINVEGVQSRVVVKFEADDRKYRQDLLDQQRLEAEGAKKRMAAYAGDATAIKGLANQSREWEKAVAAVSLPLDAAGKKAGHLSAGMGEFNKKLGEAGKQLGGMAASFGIGLAAGAVGSILGKLFEPPSPGELDRWIEQTRTQGDMFGYLANQMRDAKVAADAISGSIKTFADRQVSNMEFAKKYNAEFRANLMVEEMEKADQALADHAITTLQHASAIHDIAATWGAAANAAKQYNNAIAARPRAPAEAEAKPRRLRGGGRDWSAIYQGQYGGDNIPSAPESPDAQGFLAESWLGQGTHGEGFGGKQSAWDVKTQSKLEQMFGPIDEFNAYGEAFNLLSGAVTAAMTAWVDGSKSAGEAIKAFISQALLGEASAMAIQALKHAAWAVGSLAFGDTAGAGTHAKAALMFGAGAAAALIAAKALHSGGGGGSQPSASSGGGSSGGGRASYGGGGGDGETDGGGGGTLTGGHLILHHGLDDRGGVTTSLRSGPANIDRPIPVRVVNLGGRNELEAVPIDASTVESGGGGGNGGGGGGGSARMTPRSSPRPGVLVVVNDPLSDDGPRMRRLRLERLLAGVGIGGRDAVTFD